MFDQIVEFMNQFKAGSVILFFAGIYFILKWLIGVGKKIYERVRTYVVQDESNKSEKDKMRTAIDETSIELSSFEEGCQASIDELTKKVGEHIDESISQRSELLNAINALSDAVKAQTPKNEAFEDRLMMIEQQINLLFESDKEYMKFLNTVKSRSVKNFGTELSAQSRILTLSTCTNDNKERIVLHAVKMP